MQSLESVTSRSELQTALEKATPNESLKSAREELSRAAISAANDIAEYRITPPKDVACSQSILSYNETKDAFGTRVAGTYVAVQVVVRNLDPDHEFVLHDVQVALPIRDETSHFRAGRESRLRAASRSRVRQSSRALRHIAGRMDPAFGISTARFISKTF